jgi:hypothetical protein
MIIAMNPTRFSSGISHIDEQQRASLGAHAPLPARVALSPTPNSNVSRARNLRSRRPVPSRPVRYYCFRCMARAAISSRCEATELSSRPNRAVHCRPVSCRSADVQPGSQPRVRPSPVAVGRIEWPECN